MRREEKKIMISVNWTDQVIVFTTSEKKALKLANAYDTGIIDYGNVCVSNYGTTTALVDKKTGKKQLYLVDCGVVRLLCKNEYWDICK
ncbi:hypothetical protein DRH14_04445 [Candidatus Shapirobacteria bacterium]|nr:MAG: hypothetical protein DRH14_04445 [Candidatus Shapirobacteria bacterium]